MSSSKDLKERHDHEISRRSVLLGAAAIGGTLAVSGAFAANPVPAMAQTKPTAKTPTAQVTQAAAKVRQSTQNRPKPAQLKGWKVQPFALTDVKLNGGVFSRAQQSILALAQAYPIDRLLACFRTNAGLDDKGVEPAGGWENYPKDDKAIAKEQSWGPFEYQRGQNKNGSDGLLRGHYTGHFMSMLAQAYAESGDAAILKKINDLIDGLYECREALAAQTYQGKPRYSHPGFLAAYGEWQFKAIEEYAPYGEIWAPWYTEHKILAGLVACYQQTGNAKALDLAQGIGHWTYSRLSKCTKPQLQKMWGIYIGGEYGGMNDALIDLYEESSNDPKRDEFLKASHCFDTDKLIDNCGDGVDVLDGMHANQHLPQFVGYAKDAAIGEGDKYLKATEGLWNMVVPGRMYAHGGTGEGELWGPAHTVAGDIGTRNCESCAAYNMLKITRCLFFIDQKPEYMDYYERTLLNHILGGKSRDIDSVADLTPGNCYMYPVNPGTIKEYGDGNVGTCCGGSALESHSKYQDSIYFHSSDSTELYVNLFMPSTLDWQDTGLKLKQETNYPEAETSTITLEQVGNKAKNLKIKIRIPAWADNAKIAVNGTVISGIKPGTYATLSQPWNQNDAITVTLPMKFRTESTYDRKEIQALFYGPTVLNALNPATKFIGRSFYALMGLDGTIKLGITKEPADKPNCFIIDGDEFEPAYNGNNSPYHMYFQRKDDLIGFAGKMTSVRNPKRPATEQTPASTLMDDIWKGAPFANRAAFLRRVTEQSTQYQRDGLLSSRDRQVILLAASRAKMS
ncbi:beta-L-arabinofuranosidase domain-containing protein [Bifidobacterium sp. ESL0704]|uniref:glycoside hydrolase family 127 protein n=1 Tax=Bifidobacterium sp. ESL0704 TaxID=2983219 RepID=UPI0023F87CB4|nr:beta-L-arabinofuranosidase domain-containing protein [Bifidobacterium sp. ESL0704]WEV53181.1 glycoside hydrolase family 127 protein [Bifidobacterium sp. ESL0704]